MLSISIAEECADTLNKRYARDFNVDCVTGRISEALEKLSDDIQWDVVGLKTMRSKEQIASSLQAMSRDHIVSLSLENALAQGDRVVVNGVIRLKNDASIHFCDTYFFESDGTHSRIKRIITYGITVSKPEHTARSVRTRARG